MFGYMVKQTRLSVPFLLSSRSPTCLVCALLLPTRPSAGPALAVAVRSLRWSCFLRHYHRRCKRLALFILWKFSLLGIPVPLIERFVLLIYFSSGPTRRSTQDWRPSRPSHGWFVCRLACRRDIWFRTSTAVSAFIAAGICYLLEYADFQPGTPSREVGLTLSPQWVHPRKT
jgi:hypothetical protein